MIKLTEKQFNILAKHEDVLFRVRDSKKKISILHSVRLELARVYEEIDPYSKGVCMSCTDNWIKRLALWYSNSIANEEAASNDVASEIVPKKRGRRPRIK